MRLFTKNGHDCTDRYPFIVEAASRTRSGSFVLDGEAALLGADGISDFDGLISRRHDAEVQLYAFDVLALDGDDLRQLPLHLRKNHLARLLARRIDGISISPFEQGESARTCFGMPANLALRDWFRNTASAPIAPGRRQIGSKVKNPQHPAMHRVKEAFARERGRRRGF